MGRLCDIINFLIFSCLVLVKPVVNAWLIVYAYMFLCDDFYSTHMDNFTSFIRRRPVITNMCQIMMPSKFLKPEESSKLLQDIINNLKPMFYPIIFILHPTPDLDGILGPLTGRKKPNIFGLRCGDTCQTGYYIILV